MVCIGQTYILRKIVLVSSLVVIIVFATCKKEEKHAPEAKLEVSQISGNAPLEIRMKLTGSDLDGNADIKEYRLYIGENIIKSNSPIDTTISFRGSGKYAVYGEIVDYENQIGKSNFEYITVSPRKINPFVQPNDSTLNWYGSGDVNNDNIVNSQDLTRLNEIIAGTYSNPNDTRLYDRADVNGDGVVDGNDAQLLEKKLNGSVPYLPGSDWEKSTTEQQVEWLMSMIKINKKDKTIFPNGKCTLYAYEFMLRFHGYGNNNDLSNILKLYPYDKSKNCRFNIPALNFDAVSYNEDGTPGLAHGMNSIFVGKDINMDNKIEIEPQNDSIYVRIEKYNPVFYKHSKVFFRGPPTLDVTDGVSPTDYLTYEIKDGIWNLIYQNPNLVTERGKK